jgi:hypothetical protein
MLPAFPAFVLLTAAVPLLVPGVRLREVPGQSWRVPRRLVSAVAAALVAVLSLFPIALVAATKPIRGPHPTAFEVNSILVPESAPLQLRADPSSGGAVRLQWKPSHSAGGAVFYSVFRNAGRNDRVCGPVKNAPDLCEIQARELGTTRATEFVDHPGPGTWTYRVGITANWLNNMGFGDVYAFGRSATVTSST